ncbi:MAG: helix-turn-helix transcriptional regulator [Erysipelotrichaceae bacterium]|nr:helix-turn-helix transcriptional regulator [Erysipelotrichaceae bacterium]
MQANNEMSLDNSSDLKKIIAKNLIALRTKAKMTQLELATKLNYSDKAISKWEHGDSMPDIVILKQLADLFNVTVDYLLTDDHSDYIPKSYNRSLRRTRAVITGLAILCVWLISTSLFVFSTLILDMAKQSWVVFVYSIPLSMVVWLVFNTIWFNSRVNYIIISIMVWTLLTSIHLTAIVLGYNPWILYLLGIPTQIIIIVWSRMKHKRVKQ